LHDGVWHVKHFVMRGTRKCRTLLAKGERRIAHQMNQSMIQQSPKYIRRGINIITLLWQYLAFCAAEKFIRANGESASAHSNDSSSD